MDQGDRFPPEPQYRPNIIVTDNPPKSRELHRDYLKEHRPIQFNALVLSGSLWAYLADLNEQALQRMDNVLFSYSTYESDGSATVTRTAEQVIE